MDLIVVVPLTALAVALVGMVVTVRCLRRAHADIQAIVDDLPRTNAF